MRGAALLAAALPAAAIATASSSAVHFSSSAAADLEPLFQIAPPWLGADVATSLPLMCDGRSGAGWAANTYLWLHGDTLTGTMANGSRVVDGMPRNSVALLRVDPATGAPTSGYRHAVRPADPTQPVHVGFWSPANATQWYWPTAGVCVAGQVTVLAMRMEQGPPGLFPFVQVSYDAIQLGNVSALPADPLRWPAPPSLPLPNQNSSFLLGNAVGMDEAGGWVYLLGTFGDAPGGTAMVARVSTADWAAERYASGTQYWTGAGGWQAFGPALAPEPLFGYVPSETTLAYHPALGAWYIVIVNHFTQGATVTIRTSPGTKGSAAEPGVGAPIGPWSDPLPIYDIPAATFAGGAFCYAGKAHPELSPPQQAGGSGEFVWSYMCNTPAIPGLLNRTDIYVPQLVRTAITVAA